MAFVTTAGSGSGNQGQNLSRGSSVGTTTNKFIGAPGKKKKSPKAYWLDPDFKFTPDNVEAITGQSYASAHQIKGINAMTYRSWLEGAADKWNAHAKRYREDPSYRKEWDSSHGDSFAANAVKTTKNLVGDVVEFAPYAAAGYAAATGANAMLGAGGAAAGSGAPVGGMAGSTGAAAGNTISNAVAGSLPGAGAAGATSMSLLPYIVGGSLVSGWLGYDAADNAADASIEAANIAADAATETSEMAIDESRYQFDTIRGDTAPYRALGREAIGTMRDLNAGNMNAFYESPGYQFNLGEGQKAIDRSAVARTGGLGGRSVKEGIRYASDMASNEFGNFWNRVAAQAGIGQTAVSQSGGAGTTSAGQVGNALLTAGQTRGNAALAVGQGVAGAEYMRNQSINNAVQGGIQNYMLYDYLRR